MRVELQCSSCPCRLGTWTTPVLERITEEGPWVALGDGETFEDRIAATLSTAYEERCPECGQPVAVSEESLGQLTQELLAQW